MHCRWTTGEIAGSMMSGLKWYEMEMTFVRGLLPQSVMPMEVGQLVSSSLCWCRYIAGSTLVADSGHRTVRLVQSREQFVRCEGEPSSIWADALRVCEATY